MNFDGKDIAGFLFQYPDTDGSITNYDAVIQNAKKNGVINTTFIY
jgi:glycine cleavage system pyridoxal-binding protein P